MGLVFPSHATYSVEDESTSLALGDRGHHPARGSHEHGSREPLLWTREPPLSLGPCLVAMGWTHARALLASDLTLHMTDSVAGMYIVK